MNKKLLASLALVAMLTLASCGKTQENNEGAATTETPATSATETPATSATEAPATSATEAPATSATGT
jgi:Tfp pilus assembly protein PilN